MERSPAWQGQRTKERQRPHLRGSHSKAAEVRKRSFLRGPPRTGDLRMLPSYIRSTLSAAGRSATAFLLCPCPGFGWITCSARSLFNDCVQLETVSWHTYLWPLNWSPEEAEPCWWPGYPAPFTIQPDPEFISLPHSPPFPSPPLLPLSTLCLWQGVTV